MKKKVLIIDDDLSVCKEIKYALQSDTTTWLILSERMNGTQHVDEKDIRKHKNDILRLATFLTGREQCELPASVRHDMALFMEAMRGEQIDLKALKISGVSQEELLSVLSRIYLE